MNERNTIFEIRALGYALALWLFLVQGFLHCHMRDIHRDVLKITTQAPQGPENPGNSND